MQLYGPNVGQKNACVQLLEQHMARHRERRKRCARRRAFHDWHTLALIARAHDHSRRQIENHRIILQRAVHGHTRALLQLDRRDELINDFKEQVLTADRALRAVRRQRMSYFCAAAIFNKLEVLLFERKLTTLLHWRGIAAAPLPASPAWCTLYESAKMIGDCYRRKPMGRLLRRQQVRTRLSKVFCRMLARWIKREVSVTFRHLAAAVYPSVSATSVAFMPSSWANLSAPNSLAPPYRASAATVNRGEDETSPSPRPTKRFSVNYPNSTSENCGPRVIDENSALHSERSTSTVGTPARARHNTKPAEMSPGVNASRFGCEFDPRGFGIYADSDESSTARASARLTEPEQGVAQLLFVSGTFTAKQRNKMEREKVAGKTPSMPSCATVFQPLLPDYSKKRGGHCASRTVGVERQAMSGRPRDTAQHAPKLSSHDGVMEMVPRGDVTPCDTPTDAGGEPTHLSPATPPRPNSPDSRASPNSKGGGVETRTESHLASASPHSIRGAGGPHSSSIPPLSPHSMSSSRGSRTRPQISKRSTSPISAQTPPSPNSMRCSTRSDTQQKRSKALVSPTSAQTPSPNSMRRSTRSDTRQKRSKALVSPTSAQTPSPYSLRSSRGSDTRRKTCKPLVSPTSSRILQEQQKTISSAICGIAHSVSEAATNRDYDLPSHAVEKMSSIRVVPNNASFSNANPLKTTTTPTSSTHIETRSNQSPLGHVDSNRESSSKYNYGEPSLGKIAQRSSVRVIHESPAWGVKGLLASSGQYVAGSENSSVREDDAGSKNRSLCKDVVGSMNRSRREDSTGSENRSLRQDGAGSEESSLCENDARSCTSSLIVAPNDPHISSTLQRGLVAALRANAGDFRFRTVHNETRRTVPTSSPFAAQMRRNEEDENCRTTTLPRSAVQADGGEVTPLPFLLSRARRREEEEDRQFFRSNPDSHSIDGTNCDNATNNSDVMQGDTEEQDDDAMDYSSSHPSPRTVRQRIDANLSVNLEQTRHSTTLPRELDDDSSAYDNTRRNFARYSTFPLVTHDGGKHPHHTHYHHNTVHHARVPDAPEDDSPEESCFIQSPETRGGASYGRCNAGSQALNSKGGAGVHTPLRTPGRHEDLWYPGAAELESFESLGISLQDTVVLPGRPNVRFRNDFDYNAFLHGSPTVDPLSKEFPRARASYHVRSNAVWGGMTDEGRDTQHGQSATVVLGDPDTNTVRMFDMLGADEDGPLSETVQGAGHLSTRSASSGEDTDGSIDELFQYRSNYDPLNASYSRRQGSPCRLKTR
eukprot:GEMP01002777.1.p1 GENE.GEMP01002777.1~~GEMP01002777.1.p1  ORF type:complete len:1293 (+),score=263.92 GEMP01002777.1:61-3879(+)